MLLSSVVASGSVCHFAVQVTLNFVQRNPVVGVPIALAVAGAVKRIEQMFREQAVLCLLDFIERPLKSATVTENHSLDPRGMNGCFVFTALFKRIVVS
jgi:hypothetical protein